jgi:hypothetical protein
MPKIFIFIIFSFFSCLDYIDIKEGSSNKKYNLRPVINNQHLSPHPLNLIQSISVGGNCKGQTFKIPPIIDDDEQDNLYYLWFLDKKLASPMHEINPKARNEPISFTINKNFLENHFEGKIPNDFFLRSHFVEFIISDRPYIIPESRYIDETTDNETNHSDQIYWIFNLNNDPC